ncbi:hypothetical protein [Thermosulfurimonas sp.]|uniref:hypothetical protein n=1 Tax=Thermosulfurimonas sp. TaxID=2080236 RepID=UPI0025EABACD|nr:hypothetical protein [Thermosulfurimonas sp.]
MKEKDLLRKAALGCLFKGYLHNLRGPLQALLVQTEILENKLEAGEAGGAVAEGMKRLKEQIFKLTNLLAAAEEDMNREEIGPWPLHEILKKELTFWQAELSFKHRVEQQMHIPEEYQVRMPYNRLRAGLCALFYGLVFPLAERGGRLRLSAEGISEGVKVHFELEPPLADTQSPFFSAAREIWHPEARLEVYPERILVHFPA